MKVDRALMENTINQEYTAEQTGIHFIGWQDCSLDKDADVIVLRTESKSFFDRIVGGGSMGYSSIGNDGILSAKGYDRASGRLAKISFLGPLDKAIMNSTQCNA